MERNPQRRSTLAQFVPVHRLEHGRLLLRSIPKVKCGALMVRISLRHNEFAQLPRQLGTISRVWKMALTSRYVRVHFTLVFTERIIRWIADVHPPNRRL